ncbi:MAG: type III secretion protein [Proteobacteria bacterium]|nr:type III secretion protein [Pseudomonadota bacterium]
MNFNIEFITIEIILNFFLVMSRVGGMMLIMPVLSKRQIPPQYKIGLSIMLGTVLYSQAMSTSNSILPLDNWHLLIALSFELLIGFFIGFFFSIVFDAIATMGQLASTQMGQSASSLFDPTVQAQVSPMTNILVFTANFVFLKANGFYIVLFMLSKSYEILPINKFELDIGLLMSQFLPIFGKIFLYALELTLPFVGILLVLDLFTTLVSKILPQASMFFMIQPLKLIFGSILLSMMLGNYWVSLDDFFTEKLMDFFDEFFMGIRI